MVSKVYSMASSSAKLQQPRFTSAEAKAPTFAFDEVLDPYQDQPQYPNHPGVNLVARKDPSFPLAGAVITRGKTHPYRGTSTSWACKGLLLFTGRRERARSRTSRRKTGERLLRARRSQGKNFALFRMWIAVHAPMIALTA
ncbi:hypothetical protein KM043_014229 [Ampulex compressa]|nr:hypothetical protein KM043_014229 [Ampulex compressa]